MKHLILKNPSYQEILNSYTKWLDILGYAESTVYTLPNHLREFLHYLEAKGIDKISLINTSHISQYYQYLKQRDNKTRGGILSNAHLNKHQQALSKFREYLKKHNHKGITIHLKREKQNSRENLQILTQNEVKQLFKATDYSNKKQVIRERDKVILVLLYSCGLRRNEVINFTIKDILFDKKMILVRKGKNYKERYVPINKFNLEIIEDYIYNYRPLFCNYKASESLLINKDGKTLLGMSICNRLRRITQATNNQELIAKHPTPHILRHSIATHLLEQGAEIEAISQFLGHSSLESTQIYTHILEEKAKITKDEKLHRILREKRLQQEVYPNIPKPYYSVYHMG